MKKSLLAGISLAALIAAPAMAADLGVRPAPAYKAPPAPVAYGYNWTGIYIGGNVGGGWGRKCWTYDPLATTEGCHDVSGFLGGGQIGANYQVNQFVFGVEASGDWANLTGSNVSTLFTSFTNNTKVDGILMATARLGLAWDAALLYVKGGAAWVHDKYWEVSAGVTQYNASEWRTGWTVGGGIEYMFTPNWSVAAEYDYIGLGTRTIGFNSNATGAFAFNEDINQYIHMATLRLNYRFGGGGPIAARY